MATSGYRSGVVYDTARQNWQNTGPRPVAWAAWYPAAPGAVPTGPRAMSFFETGDVILDAPLNSRGKWPVVLLSHGTGGSAESLGWLARSLAQKGAIVIAANHHGNTGSEPYAAEGFLCWWERATDLSVLLTWVAGRSAFSGIVDLDQVSAVGFSLGGHTVLALAGARTSMDAFQRWRTDNDITDSGPREFPDAGAHVPYLLGSSPAFRASWSRAGDDFSDGRIQKFVAIAPAPPVRAFTKPTLAALEVPIVILTGGADIEAPAEHCADWLVRQNAAFKRFDLGGDVGHYTFLDFPSDGSLVGRDPIFTDHAGVDRGRVHKQAAGIILEHLF